MKATTLMLLRRSKKKKARPTGINDQKMENAILNSRHVIRTLPFEPMALSPFSSLCALVDESNQLKKVKTTTAAGRDSLEKSALAALEEAKRGNDEQLERVERRMQNNAKAGKLARQSSLAVVTPSALLPPYFVSPKHDGVRCISFGPAYKPEKSLVDRIDRRLKWCEMSFWERQRLRRLSANATNASLLSPEKNTSNLHERAHSCFTRFGRPIIGMYWIEEELLQLRQLCGDPNLVLDGELYLHRTDLRQALSTVKSRIAERQAKKATSAANSIFQELHRSSAKKEGALRTDDIVSQVALSSSSTSSEISRLSKLSGFQQVSNLVTSLRAAHHRSKDMDDDDDDDDRTKGSSIRQSDELLAASQDDLFRIVAVLPRLCVFDLVSYMPPAVPTSLMKRAMSLHGIEHATSLVVVPNRTPFIQRLRVLVFLFTLLSLYQSEHLSSSSSVSTAAAVAASPNRMPNNTSSSSYLIYRGGKYVQLVPYTTVNTLDVVPDTILKMYLRLGYEGAVVRTALNVYSAVWKKRLSKKESRRKRSSSSHQRRSRIGSRSPTATKLLPIHDSEFIVNRVLFRRGKGEGSRVPCGLECMTDRGVSFKVTLDTIAGSEQRETFIQTLKQRGSTKSGVVGLYVTLHYPALTANGVPRFPKIKGIRGRKGWFL